MCKLCVPSLFRKYKQGHTCSWICLRRWYVSSRGGKRCFTDCSAASQQGEGRRRRLSIVKERIETLTLSDSILPVWSLRQHSVDFFFLNHSQRVCCLALPDQTDFPLFEYLCGLFSDSNPQIWGWQSVPGIWMRTLMVVWSDKTSVFCHSSSVCRGSMKLARLVCSAITPEWKFQCDSNITASQLASFTAVGVGRLSPFLHPQCPCSSITTSETKPEFRWKPWQWLVTTVTTALGKASVDSCRTTVFSLHWSLTVSFYGFKASLLFKV